MPTLHTLIRPIRKISHLTRNSIHGADIGVGRALNGLEDSAGFVYYLVSIRKLEFRRFLINLEGIKGRDTEPESCDGPREATKTKAMHGGWIHQKGRIFLGEEREKGAQKQTNQVVSSLLS